MSADPMRKAYKYTCNMVRPQMYSEKSLIESVVDFFSDVVPQAYSGSQKCEDKEKIQWVKFESCDINDVSKNPDMFRSDTKGLPLLLILGYSNGVQIWHITTNGEAQEVLSLRQGPVRICRVLPNPEPVLGYTDGFSSKRPLIVLCDSSSAGQPYCGIKFVSLRTGDEVHSVSFKTLPVQNIECNERFLVTVFLEKVCVYEACTFKKLFWITSCYPCPGLNANPIALSTRWLAYADKRLVAMHQSCGGMSGDGAQSYAATVISAAKGAFKGLSMFGEAMVSSVTGSKPSAPKRDPVHLDNGNRPGIVSVIDIQNIHNDHFNVTEDNEGDGLLAHFHAHANEPVAHLAFNPTGTLLVTACKLGHNFHVFRLMAHPVSSALGAIHHLYTLHRGDTTAKVIDVSFTHDSRWVTVSSHRGTTHLFPITPYGGPVNIRTHGKPHVVNRASKFRMSAGLDDLDPSHVDRHSPVLSTSPSSSVQYDRYPTLIQQNTLNNNMGNPRLPPYPHPITIQPAYQIKQPLNVVLNPASKNQSPSHSPTGLDNVYCVCAKFCTPRLCVVGSPKPDLERNAGKRPVDSLFVMAQSGTLVEYMLEPRARTVGDKVTEDCMLELGVGGRMQWNLQRLKNSQELRPPLPSNSPLMLAHEAVVSQVPTAPDLYDLPGLTRHDSRDSLSSDHSAKDDLDETWVSQVEIITHVGPHRRLWMGPQFSFKTYQENTTVLSSHSSALLSQSPESNMVAMDMAGDEGDLESLKLQPTRSNPVSMPNVRPAYRGPLGSENSSSPGQGAGHPLMIEAGSFDQSPFLLDVYSNWTESTVAKQPRCSIDLEEDCLKEIADAMVESPIKDVEKLSLRQQETARSRVRREEASQGTARNSEETAESVKTRQQCEKPDLSKNDAVKAQVKPKLSGTELCDKQVTNKCDSISSDNGISKANKSKKPMQHAVDDIVDVELSNKIKCLPVLDNEKGKESKSTEKLVTHLDQCDSVSVISSNKSRKENKDKTDKSGIQMPFEIPKNMPSDVTVTKANSSQKSDTNKGDKASSHIPSEVPKNMPNDATVTKPNPIRKSAAGNGKGKGKRKAKKSSELANKAENPTEESLMESTIEILDDTNTVTDDTIPADSYQTTANNSVQAAANSVETDLAMEQNDDIPVLRTNADESNAASVWKEVTCETSQLEHEIKNEEQPMRPNDNQSCVEPQTDTPSMTDDDKNGSEPQIKSQLNVWRENKNSKQSREKNKRNSTAELVSDIIDKDRTQASVTVIDGSVAAKTKTESVVSLSAPSTSNEVKHDTSQLNHNFVTKNEQQPNMPNDDQPCVETQIINSSVTTEDENAPEPQTELPHVWRENKNSKQGRKKNKRIPSPELKPDQHAKKETSASKNVSGGSAAVGIALEMVEKPFTGPLNEDNGNMSGNIKSDLVKKSDAILDETEKDNKDVHCAPIGKQLELGMQLATKDFKQNVSRNEYDVKPDILEECLEQLPSKDEAFNKVSNKKSKKNEPTSKKQSASQVMEEKSEMDGASNSLKEEQNDTADQVETEQKEATAEVCHDLKTQCVSSYKQVFNQGITKTDVIETTNSENKLKGSSSADNFSPVDRKKGKTKTKTANNPDVGVKGEFSSESTTISDTKITEDFSKMQITSENTACNILSSDTNLSTIALKADESFEQVSHKKGQKPTKIHDVEIHSRVKSSTICKSLGENVDNKLTENKPKTKASLVYGERAVDTQTAVVSCETEETGDSEGNGAFAVMKEHKGNKKNNGRKSNNIERDNTDLVQQTSNVESSSIRDAKGKDVSKTSTRDLTVAGAAGQEVSEDQCLDIGAKDGDLSTKEEDIKLVIKENKACESQNLTINSSSCTIPQSTTVDTREEGNAYEQGTSEISINVDGRYQNEKEKQDNEFATQKKKSRRKSKEVNQTDHMDSCRNADGENRSLQQNKTDELLANADVKSEIPKQNKPYDPFANDDREITPLQHNGAYGNVDRDIETLKQSTTDLNREDNLEPRRLNERHLINRNSSSPERDMSDIMEKEEDFEEARESSKSNDSEGESRYETAEDDPSVWEKTGLYQSFNSDSLTNLKYTLSEECAETNHDERKLFDDIDTESCIESDLSRLTLVSKSGISSDEKDLSDEKTDVIEMDSKTLPQSVENKMYVNEGSSESSGSSNRSSEEKELAPNFEPTNTAKNKKKKRKTRK